MADPYAARHYTIATTPMDLSSYKVFGMMSNFKRLTEIAKVQNFWSSNVILDGRYPALVWEHEFLVSRVDSLVMNSYSSYIDFASGAVQGTPKPLHLIHPTAGSIIAFGDTYFDSVTPQSPDQFLVATANIFKLKFIGNTKPSVSIPL